MLAAFALEVMSWARGRGIAATLEQPAASWMWRLRSFAAEVDGSGRDSVVTLDYFSFGAPWKKATRVWGVNCGLEPLRRRCQGGHVHVQLRGRMNGEMATRLAQAYPAQLADQWAACLMRGCLRAAPEPEDAGGRGELPFDATLGYPGEGPTGQERRSHAATVEPLTPGSATPAGPGGRLGPLVKGPVTCDALAWGPAHSGCAPKEYRDSEPSGARRAPTPSPWSATLPPVRPSLATGSRSATTRARRRCIWCATPCSACTTSGRSCEAAC